MHVCSYLKVALAFLKKPVRHRSLITDRAAAENGMLGNDTKKTKQESEKQLPTQSSTAVLKCAKGEPWKRSS